MPLFNGSVRVQTWGSHPCNNPTKALLERGLVQHSSWILFRSDGELKATAAKKVWSSHSKGLLTFAPNTINALMNMFNRDTIDNITECLFFTLYEIQMTFYGKWDKEKWWVTKGSYTFAIILMRFIMLLLWFKLYQKLQLKPYKQQTCRIAILLLKIA